MPHTDRRRWTKTPGGWAALQQHRIFPGDGEFGIPVILRQDFQIPAEPLLTRWTTRDDDGRLLAASIAHFYLDDYRLESMWTRPSNALRRARRFWGVCTPDFSLYRNWPRALQIWNVYRARWVGRWLQLHNIRVIPTVNWGGPDTFDFCFAGLQRGQVLSIAVPDLRDPTAEEFFEHGYRRMLADLTPAAVLVYGQIPFPCERAAQVKPDWHRLRALGDHGSSLPVRRARASLQPPREELAAPSSRLGPGARVTR